MAARRARGKGDAKGSRKAGSDAAERRDHQEFVSEAEETLERMREDLSDLHEQRRAAAEVAPDLVNRVFRSAHSLKGLAGMFGLEAIGELAHHHGLELGGFFREDLAVGPETLFPILL
jgi:chemotaxis protein histidine kinase CheA